MKRFIFLVLTLMLSLMLWGCSGSGQNATSPEGDSASGKDKGAAKEVTIQVPDTPDGVLTAFLEAYQDGSEKDVSQLSLGGENLIQEVDDLIDLLYYDAASTEKIREGFRGFEFEIDEVVEETDNTAKVQLKINGHQVDKAVEEDLRKLLRESAPSLDPLKNDFEKWLPFSENYPVYLKKEGEYWQVDLENEENKPLINTLAGYFPAESRTLLNQKLDAVSVSGDSLPPEMPNHEVHLKDNGATRTFNVDPAQRAEGLAVPLYGHLLMYGYYTSWEEDEQILYVIKDNNVFTLPFKTVPVGSREVTWADLENAEYENLEAAD